MKSLIIKAIAIIAGVLSLPFQALSIDSYDAATGQLTIPSVQVGATTFTNVVVTVASVIRIGGGLAVGTQDSYNAGNSQLTIPAVTVGATTYTNVTITVGNVISASGSFPTPLTTQVGSSYELQKSSVHINRGSVNASGGFLHGIAYADFDLDGDIDVISAPGTGQNATTPVELWLNDGANNFTQDATFINGAAPGLIHARKSLPGDFNGDGEMDLFIVGHGFDQPPFSGERPLLLMNAPGAGTAFYAVPTGAPAGFQHGGATADIDGDGDLDIFVVDTSQSFFLINDGIGNLAYSTANLGLGFSNLNYYTAELLDVNSDGFIDIIMGGHEQDGAATKVFWGSATRIYSNASATTLPAIAGNGVVMDIDAEDIDGDGDRDIILNRTGDGRVAGLNFYQGFNIQILENRGAQGFVDVSSTRIVGGSNPAQNWFDYLRMQDKNNDGFLDIIVDDAGRNLIWYNNGSGVFN